jgi:hypothetical protein
MNLDLRALTVSEFLDRTFSVYRHRFLLFVALMAPQALLSLVAAMLWAWATASMQTPDDLRLEKLVALMIGVGVGAIVFTLLHWVLYVLGIGATTAAVSDLHGQMRPEVGPAFAAAFRRLGPLLWLTFLMAVRVAGMFAACAFLPGVLIGIAGGMGAFQPGSGGAALAVLTIGFTLLGLAALVAIGFALFMGLRYTLAIPAVMLEPIGGREAIRRSIRLMRTFFGHAFLLMICGGFVGWAASMVLQVPFVIAALVVGPETRTGFWLNLAGTATGTAGQTMTAPIVAIGVVVLYFSARVRHEALDLQVMTQALAPVPSAGPIPSPGPATGFAASPPPPPLPN